MQRKDPETKEELLNRLLMADFDGDIRNLGGEAARVKRVAPHMLRLEFPDSGAIFDLTVHRPRKPGILEARRKGEARTFNAAAEVVDDWTVDPSQPQRPQKRRASPTRPATGSRDARG